MQNNHVAGLSIVFRQSRILGECHRNKSKSSLLLTSIVVQYLSMKCTTSKSDFSRRVVEKSTGVFQKCTSCDTLIAMYWSIDAIGAIQSGRLAPALDTVCFSKQSNVPQSRVSFSLWQLSKITLFHLLSDGKKNRSTSARLVNQRDRNLNWTDWFHAS